MNAILVAEVALLIVLGGAGIALWGRLRAVRLELAKAKDSIGLTSRLLIEKNVELFDQNVAQQKMLAIKDDFLAIASHQLRTPLSEVRWSIGELIDAAPEGDLRRAYERIFVSTNRMQRIIEDLLRLVEVQQGEVRAAVTPYDPNPLIRAAAASIAHEFPESSLSVSFELLFSGALSCLDEASLGMLVGNLIENAYHYTRPRGSVVLKTKSGSEGAFVFEIEDSGIGISPEMAANMFSKFRRAQEAIELNKDGSGLGLYIVKTLSDRARGSVAYEPRQGGGSVFRVSLPAAPKT